jgi:outer membrane protein OmpA-like peptidoglycan-associated protein
MNANLLSLAKDALGGDFAKLAGQFLGESQGATQSALGSLLPAVLGGIAQKGATPQGATGLMSLINGANLDVASLGNIAGLFGGGGSGVNALLKAGTSSLVPALFGDKSGALVNALSSSSGIKTASATNLLAMTVPLLLTFLKKFMGDKGLNANSLSALLSGQGPHLQGALDSRMSSALGFASPAAFLSGLGGQAADTAMRAGAAVAGGAAAATTATKSGLMRWLPWLIGAAVLLFLWNLLSGRSTTTPAPAPTAAVTAPAPMPAPAPATISLPAKVYFEVGAATIGADGSKTLGAAADMIKKDGLKVTVTGYTDKTGDVAKNEELAKSRALAVADALKAAGVAEASIETKPPMFVEVGAAGGDAEARRVEINKQ